MLLLEAGMIGVFVALDLFLFYVFWEAMLIPMYFLIGIWGHERRIYAAVKFFLYTFAGSVLMLVAFLVLYKSAGLRSFDIPALVAAPVDPALQTWLFLACALAFAIKVPMWPFHTWLPDAHVEAPTAGSVILAGVLLKMGGYGFLRLAIPLFPDAAVRFAPLDRRPRRDRHRLRRARLAGAARPQEARRLLVGVPPRLRDARHRGLHAPRASPAPSTRCSTTASRRARSSSWSACSTTGATRALISEFGGLRAVMPWFFAVFLLISLSSIAVPGFNGFVGEFLILLGSWTLQPARWWRSPRSGVILAAAYILWMVKRVFYGEVTNPKNAGPARPVRRARRRCWCRSSCSRSSWAIASPLFTRQHRARRPTPWCARCGSATQPAPRRRAAAPPATPAGREVRR